MIVSLELRREGGKGVGFGVWGGRKGGGGVGGCGGGVRREGGGVEFGVWGLWE